MFAQSAPLELSTPRSRRRLAHMQTTHSHDTHMLATSESTAPGSAAPLSSTTTTPPITPPTPPPLNMIMSGGSASQLTATPTSNSSSASAALSPASMAAATLLAHHAATPLSSTGCAAVAAAAAAAAPPASSEHYSLRWNNHQNHILRAFDALLQTKTLVDVTLVCAETSIRAHKMVLSACSPFFQRVFAETPCKHPVIVLKDFRGWVVQAIVDFMYRGEISVPQERLQTLIQAGESLQVRGLVESSVPEHTPTPAASPDAFAAMIDASLMSSAAAAAAAASLASELLERRRSSSSYEDESPPSMVAAGSKVIMPSRLFGATARRERERKRERDRDRERDHEHDRELQACESDEPEALQPLELTGHGDPCTSPMPRRKQARPRRRSGELTHELATAVAAAVASAAVSAASRPASPAPMAQDAPAPAPATGEDQLERERECERDEVEEPLALDKESMQAAQLDALKTVIKSELADEDEPMDEDDAGRNDANAPLLPLLPLLQEEERSASCVAGSDRAEEQHAMDEVHAAAAHGVDDHERTLDREHEQEPDHDELEREQDGEGEGDDIEALLHGSSELHRHSRALYSATPDPGEGPEDLCTTKKDNDSTSGQQAPPSDHEGSPSNNNNNNNKLSNNNNRIVLSLKDIRTLNKPSASANAPLTPTHGHNGSQNNNNMIHNHNNSHNSHNSHTSHSSHNNSMHPFAAASLRDLRLDRAAENQCKIDALEAQMHAAAVAAAASGENPFQLMEHQMDLSLAAAAAAAAVSHQQSRERDQAMMQQREQRELQQQHNAYANSLLGQMGMPGMPPFGPPGGKPGGPNGGGCQAPHERLEESMNRLSKEFGPSSPMSLPSHFNPSDGQQHPPSPLPFPGMSSALTLTPPHMFGLDSPLGLFPPGIDPGKLYNPLMEMSDPRGMDGGPPPPYLKKKMPRPKGQHSAPRGGPPRSWTNAELTEALQHVWNKKMTTSQASRIFGIPYNSLLMYVRGKYGKSLKLEQLRKDCISGPPLELLQMGISGGSGGGGSKSSKNKDKSGNGGGGSAGGGGNSGGGGGGGGNGGASGNANEPLDMGSGSNAGPGGGGGGPGSMQGCGGGMPDGMGVGGPRSASSEPDLLGGPNSIFNPFPQGFYPDFPGGFPGLPLSMLNLLPPAERHHASAALHHLGMDEDCKSDRSKQSSMDEDYGGLGIGVGVGIGSCSGQPLGLGRDEQRPPIGAGGAAGLQPNGGAHD